MTSSCFVPATTWWRMAGLAKMQRREILARCGRRLLHGRTHFGTRPGGRGIYSQTVPNIRALRDALSRSEPIRKAKIDRERVGRKEDRRPCTFPEITGGSIATEC